MSLRLSLNRITWLLGGITFCLALNFYAWPVNRDITIYSTIAWELSHGKMLYLDQFDVKPPGIYVAYMLVQWLIESRPLQFFVLQVVPLLAVLVTLVRCGPKAGFGTAAGICAGLVWVTLSGDIALQMPWPNTEVYINACVTLAMLLMLGLDGRRRSGTALMIGLLFAVACLFKTVAIAMAGFMGLAHVLIPPAGSSRSKALRELLLMAASGAAAIGSVVLYFAATGRLHVFTEAMTASGVAYAGSILQNVIDGMTFAPIIGRGLVKGLVVATLPWLALLAIAWIDKEHRRAWALLGAYGFSALVAVGIPGSFYAHYFQLLVPPLCLGTGWYADRLTRQFPTLRKAVPLAFGVALLGLAAFESRPYLSPPEVVLKGTYADLYRVTRDMGRRLGSALHEDEVLYQWGEESGLYWYGRKRPPASVMTYYMLAGPQAPRITRQTMAALQARPPDLIVVVNYIAEDSRGHPVLEWIRANYRAVAPEIPAERRYFTFYVPADSSPEFVRRVVANGPALRATD